jgi:hypothetical protein
VPDLELFPAHYEGVQTVTFHAGPEYRWQHEALRVMARLAERRFVSSWRRYSGFLERMNSLMSAFGTSTGYMQVEIEAEDALGRPHVRTWNLIAKQNHGPEIPGIPARILAKKLVAGQIKVRGARACLSLIDLDEFTRETAEFDIACSVESTAIAAQETPETRHHRRRCSNQGS